VALIARVTTRRFDLGWRAALQDRLAPADPGPWELAAILRAYAAFGHSPFGS
jgi:hypothetical protein